MKRYLIFSILIWFLCLTGLCGSAFAQTEGATLTDEGTEQMTEETTGENVEADMTDDEKYAMWSDPLYFQFEKMMPALARSIGRLDTRISTLAVTNSVYGTSLNDDAAFKKVSEAKLFGQLLLENPRLKLIKCDECNRITTEVKNGIMTISRGLKDQKARSELAKKLGVQGFMNAMITEEERQLTIVINVHDAQEGRIVLSDVIAGDPVPKSRYWHIYAGRLTIPVKMQSGNSVDQTAITIGAEYTIRFSESWIVASNLAFYMDNNSKLGEADTDYVAFTSGLMFDGTIAWEAASFMRNNAAFSINTGVGQFISTQFNFSVYYRAGLKLTLGQRLTFNLSYFSFSETNISKPDNGSADSLPGSATALTFGYQF